MSVCEIGEARRQTSVGWSHALGLLDETVHFFEFRHAGFDEYSIISLENLLKFLSEWFLVFCIRGKVVDKVRNVHGCGVNSGKTSNHLHETLEESIPGLLPRVLDGELDHIRRRFKIGVSMV